MTSEQKFHRGRRIAIIAGILVAILVVWGIASRMIAASHLRAETERDAVPIVTVTRALAPSHSEQVVLPGSVRAVVETPIYARIGGYIKAWHADIGAHVEAGTVLAEIEAPEVDQQLRQAQAELRTAQANANIASTTAKRVQGLLASQSVSRQEADERSAAAAAAASLVASAEANVDRLRQLTAFENVTAPYAGTVTARDTDVGALVNAGSGVGPVLFRVADTSRLRIYVQVPQTYAAEIKPGLAAELHFPEYPGRVFPAIVVRTARALDPVARTLQVELDEDNRSGELFPGSYADVHFNLPVAKATVRVPANVLMFRAEGLRVAVVDQDNKVSLHKVVQGRDFGTDVEIVQGLAARDRVIQGPPASLEDGQQVRIAPPQTAQAAP